MIVKRGTWLYREHLCWDLSPRGCYSLDYGDKLDKLLMELNLWWQPMSTQGSPSDLGYLSIFK